MYLNHQFINAAVARFVLRHVAVQWGSASLHNVLTTAVLVALSVLAAVVTFCLIEHPFLRMRVSVLDRPRAAAGEHAPHRSIRAQVPSAG